MNRFAGVVLLLVATVLRADAMTIHGKVVDSKTRLAVSGIVAHAEHFESRNADEPDLFGRDSTTGSNGVFTLELPPSEKQYTVLLSDKAGHVYEGFTHLHENKDLGTVELKRGCALSGAVRDANGAPVAGAEVVLDIRLRQYTCEHHVQVAKAKTDKDGAFDFSDLSPAQYRCRAVADPYAPAENSIEVGDDLAFLELRLQPACTIAGKVVGPDGKPVPSITVKIGREHSAMTGTNGAFVLKGLPAGQQQIRIFSKEYTLAKGDSVSVKCAIGKPAACELKVARAGTLKLELKPETPQVKIPASVHVQLMPADARQSGRSHSASGAVKDRRVTLEGLPVGSYTANVSGDGMGAASAEVSIKAGEVTLAAVVLPRVQGLSGRVVDEKGGPIKGAQVRAEKIEPEEGGKKAEVRRRTRVSFGGSQFSQTGADGKFKLEGLAFGEYKFGIQHGEFMPLEKKIVISAESKGETNFTMARGLSISGTVMESDGSPATGIKITAMGPKNVRGSSIWREAELKPDGAFALSGLSSGKYDVAIQQTESGEQETTLPDVAAGADDLFVSLGRKQAVTVLVVDASGKPVKDAAIAWSRQKGDETTSFAFSSMRSRDQEKRTTDSQGRFTLSLREGAAYGITAMLKPYLPGTASVNLAGGTRAPAGPVRIALESGCRVTGTVVSAADGKPVEGVTVAANEEGGLMGFRGFRGGEDGEEGATPTGKDGRFAVDGVRAGVVELVVMTGGDKKQVIANRKINVSKGAAQQDVRIEVGRMGIVKGKAVSAEGPMAGCQVVIYSMQSPTANLQVETDEKGEFVIENVAPAQYMLMWTDSRSESPFGSGRRPITVKVDAGKTVEVTLRSGTEDSTGATLRGTVTRNGRPLGPGSMSFMPARPEGGAMEAAFMMGGQAREGKLADDGTFFVEAVSTGRYVVVLHGGAGEDAGGEQQETKAAQQWMYNASIDIAAGQTNLDIKLSGAALEGTVKDAQGAPLGEAYVLLSPQDSGQSMLRQMQTRYAQTDSLGKYAFDCVAAGRYELRVQHAEGGMIRKRGVDVSAGTQRVDLAVAAGFKLKGKVVAAAGGVRGAMVIALSDADDETCGFAQTKADGAFEMGQALPAGEYKVLAFQDGYAIVARKVKVTQDFVFDATLAPGGTLKVRLSGAKGAKLANRVVRVKTAAGQEVLRCRNAEWLMAGGPWSACVIAPTDDQGCTTVGALEPGEYRVTVDGEAGVAEAAVKALETAEVEFSLMSPAK